MTTRRRSHVAIAWVWAGATLVAAGCGGASVTKPATDQEPTYPELKTELGAELRQLTDPATRDAAAAALASRGPAALPELKAALTHENPRVRAGAAFTLTLLGRDALPLLADLRKQADQENDDAAQAAMRFAAEALGELQGSK